MDENEEFEFRLRAEREAQAAPAALPAAPKEGGPVPETGVPSGFHKVTDDNGASTLRKDFGPSDVAQSILDLPGVGTAANMAVGTWNTAAKAASGILGPLGRILGIGDNAADNITATRQALSVQPAQTRDPISQGLGAVEQGLSKITKPAEDAVADMSPGARTAIEAGAEAVPDIAAVLGAKAPLEGLANEMKAAPVKAPGAPARSPQEVADAAGFRLSENERQSGPVRQTVEKLTGRANREADNQTANQQRRNEIAREDMGLPAGKPLSSQAFADAEKPHAAVYEEVRQALPSIKYDQTFRDAVQNAAGRKSDVPEAAAVRRLKDDFAALEDTNGTRVLNTISELRSAARTEMRSDKVAIQRRGEARNAIADAYEDLLARNLEPTNPDLMQRYQDARKGFATVRTYRDATVGQNVDAAKLAKIAAKNKGVSGGARVIADVQNNFPQSQKLGQKITEPAASPNMLGTFGRILEAVPSVLKFGGRKALEATSRPNPNRAALSDYYRSPPEAPAAAPQPFQRLGAGSVNFEPTPGVPPASSLLSELGLAPEPVANPQQLPEAPSRMTADVVPPVRGDINFTPSQPELAALVKDLGIAPPPGRGVPYDLEYSAPSMAAQSAPDLNMLADLVEQLGLRVDTPQPSLMTPVEQPVPFGPRVQLEAPPGRVGKLKKPKK